MNGDLFVSSGRDRWPGDCQGIVTPRCAEEFALCSIYRRKKDEPVTLKSEVTGCRRVSTAVHRREIFWRGMPKVRANELPLAIRKVSMYVPARVALMVLLVIQLPLPFQLLGSGVFLALVIICYSSFTKIWWHALADAFPRIQCW